MKNRTELAKYFAELGFVRGAEIGVDKGRYSKMLLDNIPGLTLLCVDSWHSRRGRYRDRPIARKVLGAYPSATILQGFSDDIAKLIVDESLDFVFIDAEHSYEHVKEDILEWARKVRKGGIVSGHDYFDRSDIGVIKAVDEYIEKSKYKLELTEWDLDSEDKDDRQPCWYFIKT